MEKKLVRIAVDVDSEVREQLHELARRWGRTLNGSLIHMIRESLKRERAKGDSL